ncbi:MAG: DPP IV N-terminal domain-containing protein [Gemmatimonadaceae bacterium]|nr:DPP IV N-terminal domain-containing protein [Chitinophagaceae bacterium]
MGKKLQILVCILLATITSNAQQIKWAADGNSYFKSEGGDITKYTMPANTKSVFIGRDKLKPEGLQKNLTVRNFYFDATEQQVLLYTNTKKVWRLDTRGDYWLYNVKDGSLKQLGKSLPASSMMFAKFSPDGKSVAYVSNYNLYVEDLAGGQIKQLTKDGNRKLINGTFDWVYEEEFFCRDGFRWSPDSKQLAYWQIDAKSTKDYLMVNNTDSIYPVAVPVEYPVAGEAPSPYKIGVIEIATAQTKWMDIPTDPILQSYVPRMEWSGSNELILQHLNRKQNESTLMLVNTTSGASSAIYKEKDSAWIDILALWDNDYIWGGWDWLNAGKEFMWASEKDGWRHLYRISRDGKKETLITAGNYDVMDICRIDEKNGYVYFMASPTNATQKYLYRTKLDGKGKAEQVSPANQQGTHNYRISANGMYAQHSFSNYYTQAAQEWITLPDHKGINNENKVADALAKADKSKSNITFFKVKTADNVEMDAWMAKPDNFDSTKKYPIVFYVYTEPWGQNVIDQYGTADNFLYKGDMAKDGYLYVSIDNRGTPVPKGRAWRKSVYRKIGLVNIRDQAMAAKEIFKWNFVDTSRVAVWGWSGGGSATLNLMFQYPEIYKAGVAVAPVGNQLTYDNIYQERYMGLPQENREDFVKGSPMTYAKNLQGNLLYVHGTGDDNVHYNNADMLINELVKYNKQFQLMSYPNRTHSISEGPGTFEHLSTLYTSYLRQHCPPGARPSAVTGTTTEKKGF